MGVSHNLLGETFGVSRPVLIWPAPWSEPCMCIWYIHNIHLISYQILFIIQWQPIRTECVFQWYELWKNWRKFVLWGEYFFPHGWWGDGLKSEEVLLRVFERTSQTNQYFERKSRRMLIYVISSSDSQTFSTVLIFIVLALWIINAFEKNVSRPSTYWLTLEDNWVYGSASLW